MCIDKWISYTYIRIDTKMIRYKIVKDETMSEIPER